MELVKNPVTCAFSKCSSQFEQKTINHRYCCTECWHKSQRSNVQGSEYQAWKKAVFLRDGYQCQMCAVSGVKSSDSKLIAHHVVTISDCPEARLEVSNGLTLCITCHEVIHDNVGKSNSSLIMGRERQKAFGATGRVK